MADTIEFEQIKPGADPECLACEALLADVLDEALSPADQAWMDRHVATCSRCSEALGDARRGAAWLEMLKTLRPEPSAHLLERILAQTSGTSGVGLGIRAGIQADAQADVQADAQLVGLEDRATLGSSDIGSGRPADAAAGPGAMIPLYPALPGERPQPPYLAPVVPFRARPAVASAWLPSFRRTSFEPRLAMTAAMAFFSIALTMNLAGVRLDQVHVADLNPASLKRSFYEVKGDAARRYDSLRVVHVLESRVEELKTPDAGRDAALAPGAGRRGSSQSGAPRGGQSGASQTLPPDGQPGAQPGARPETPHPETAQPETAQPQARPGSNRHGVSRYAVPEAGASLLPASAVVISRAQDPARKRGRV